jgi:hypothetical protein
MSETQKNIQAIAAIAGVLLLVSGFAMFKLAFGLIVAGVACLVPTLFRARK